MLLANIAQVCARGNKKPLLSVQERSVSNVKSLGQLAQKVVAVQVIINHVIVNHVIVNQGIIRLGIRHGYLSSE
jgi:hypothetical protein